ncbi:MAG: hypothetical protein ACOX5G_02460 [Kiritimatiellia bacterium]
MTMLCDMDHRHRLAELRSGNAAPVHYGYDAENRYATVSNTAFRATYAYTSDGWDAGYSVNLTNGVVLDRVVSRDPYRRSLVKAITNSVNGVPYNPLAYTYDLRVVRLGFARASGNEIGLPPPLPRATLPIMDTSCISLGPQFRRRAVFLRAVAACAAAAP